MLEVINPTVLHPVTGNSERMSGTTLWGLNILCRQQKFKNEKWGGGVWAGLLIMIHTSEASMAKYTKTIKERRS